MKSNKGFTLIELLVVIAIIGILSSVVLASLNSARTKGADAATKSNINNARAQAELYYDNNNGSYVGVCTNAGINTQLQGAVSSSGSTGTTTALETSTTVACNSDATTWAASAPLKGGGYYCVDSTGKATSTATPLAAGGKVCI